MPRATQGSAERLFPWIAVLLGLGCGAPSTGPSFWGQTQSHLEVFNGRPLLSANWHGRHRPYVYDGGRFRPVIRPEPPGADGLDLYTPVSLSPSEVLLAGTQSGRPDYDIFIYDVASGSLTNLTASPSLDEGRLCVHAGSRRVAYRSGSEQRFARVAARLEPLSHGRVPGFQRCLFLDADTVLGVEKRRTGPVLQRCRIEASRVRCETGPALDGVEHFLKFVRTPSGDTGVIARRGGESFRQAFLFDGEFTALRRVSPDPPVAGDVLDYDGHAFRIGFESRYYSSLDPGFDGIVYRTRRIGGTQYAIVATAARPRGLARLGPDGWELIAASAVPTEGLTPRELWLTSNTGERYQAFHFGAEAASAVVVWWHGGPHENVSPRFNPYFHALNRMGFAVLAVNYPGSTGRGAAFERRFEPASVADCIAAVWRHLDETGAERVISWSVSSGVTVQELLLSTSFRVDAVVDQSGWGRTRVLAQAERRGVPSFAIRGRNDPNAPSPRVDHWYPDGHDITMADQFEAAMTAVEAFLRRPPG